MKTKKIALITAVSVLMIAQASSTVFGTFQYDQRKGTSGEPVEYRVGLLNLGSTPLKVETEASAAEQVSIDIEESFNVSPSNVSETPGDGKWFYLGDGRYAEVQVIEFEASSKDFRKESFDISFSAYSRRQATNAGFGQIIQERTYSFTIYNSSYREGLIEFEEQDEEKQDEEGGGSENITIDSTSEPEQGKDEEGGEGSFQSLTLILGAGALLSTIYLTKVMLL